MLRYALLYIAKEIDLPGGDQLEADRHQRLQPVRMLREVERAEPERVARPARHARCDERAEIDAVGCGIQVRAEQPFVQRPRTVQLAPAQPPVGKADHAA